ncbi:MAG TPA: C2H2-type zinc finger protein, partial [Candidatus Babeliales bacterium]|nr:C2H2-type zinc finger protein [Candidatus Babeliales bacterium]
MKAHLNMYLWRKLGLLKLSWLLVIFSSQNVVLSAVSDIDTVAELLAADRDELDRVFLADLLSGTAAPTTDSGSVAILPPTDVVTTTALTPPVAAAASMLVQSQAAKPRSHVCSDCGEVFARRGDLTRHLR